MKRFGFSAGLSAVVYVLTTTFFTTKSVATDFVGGCNPVNALYEDSGFGGRELGICGERSNLGAICARRNFANNCTWDWNDKASSVKFNGNGVLVLWSDSNYSGRIIVLGRGNYDLNDYNLNDDANSVAIYSGTNAPFKNKFYKKINDSAVYWFGDNGTCHVRDPDQMNRFGGFGIVNLVSPNVNIPNANVNQLCKG